MQQMRRRGRDPKHSQSRNRRRLTILVGVAKWSSAKGRPGLLRPTCTPRCSVRACEGEPYYVVESERTSVRRGAGPPRPPGGPVVGRGCTICHDGQACSKVSRKCRKEYTTASESEWGRRGADLSERKPSRNPTPRPVIDEEGGAGKHRHRKNGPVRTSNVCQGREGKRWGLLKLRLGAAEVGAISCQQVP
jgi:hypothetical protein